MVIRGVPESILVLSADMGEGHNAAAAALTEAIHELWPECRVERLDTVEARGRRFGLATRWAYASTMRWTPWLYEAFYDALCRYSWFADPLKKATCRFFGRRIERLVASREPDLIISTYPFGSAALEWMRTARGMSTPTVTFTPAFHIHPYWAYSHIDLHFVMYPTAIRDAKTRGLEGHMVIGAPPVRRCFGEFGKSDGRRKMGLRQDAFVLLVTGGAWGLGSQEEAVRALVDLPGELQIVTVCGRNEEIRQRLSSLGVDPERLTVLGYVDTMAELMAAADVVVTNGAGVTVLEALRTERPVIAFEPLAGHGRAATAVMEGMGLAVSCRGADGLAATVQRLMTDATLMARLQQAGRDFASGKDLRNDVRRMGDLLSKPAGYREVG